MAKIIKAEENELEFDDGTKITCDHDQDCCEYNYAAFDAIDDICRATNFDTSKLVFESCEYGFRFGNAPAKMFYVPCYSDQNGYYTDEVDVYLNGVQKLTTCGEMI